MSEASPTTKPLQNTHVPSPAEGTSTAPLEGETLKEELQKQLDYVFSKNHLATDPLLVSKMNADNFVPINVIQELPSIKKLTTDEAQIHAALRASPHIVVDEEKMMARPAEKLVQRNTVILRDVPADVQVEEVRALFNGQEKFLAAVEEMKSDIANTFFIRFNNEAVTLDAYNFLIEQTLHGQPVKARVKSENLIKSYYYGAQTGNNQYYNNNPEMAANNGNPYTNNWNRSYDNSSMYQQTDASGFNRGGYGDGRRGGRGGFNPSRRRKDFRGGKTPYGEGTRGGRRSQGRGGGKKSPSSSPNPKNDTRRPNNNNTVLPVAASHWPPLPSSTNEKKNKTGGYSKEFTKYSRESIISVISTLKDEMRPNFENQCPAVLDTGFHTDLEVSKQLPDDAVVEWVDIKKVNSRRTSKKGRNPNKQSIQDSVPEPELLAPPSAWPSVNSSTVKQPPTTQQQRNNKQQKTKPAPKQNKPNTKQQQQKNNPKTAPPASQPNTQTSEPSNSASSPEVAVSQEPTPSQNTTSQAQPSSQAVQGQTQSQSEPTAEASVTTTNTQSSNPSYADIARARGNQQPTTTQD